MSAPTAESLELLARDREAVLLRKFLTRGLLPEEMAELKHLLPLEVLANPPERRPEYRHVYKVYADKLNVDERQIKRLVEAGRTAKGGIDFPPFDEPGKFLAWWRRCMKGEPRANLFAFAKSAAAAPASPPVAAAADSAPLAAGAPPPPPSSDLPAPSIGFDMSGAGGFEGSVRELRATVASAQRRLREAMMAKPLDESLVASCNRTVAQQLDLLRKSENDLFEFQQKRGELVPKSEIREDWRTLLSAMRRMRERMESNVESALAKTAQFTAEQLVLVKAAVGSERAREDQLLRTSRFWRTQPENV